VALDLHERWWHHFFKVAYFIAFGLVRTLSRF